MEINKSLSEYVVRLKNHYTFDELASVVVFLLCEKYCIKNVKNQFIKQFLNVNLNEQLIRELKGRINSINDAEIVFEYFFDDEVRKNSGIVFTPTYIIDYIYKLTVTDISFDTRILDPSCGTGSFLLYATSQLHKKLKKPVDQILKDNIYGFEIKIENVVAAKILLSFLSIIEGFDNENFTINIYHLDSLRDDIFKKYDMKFSKFDYIIGNPPYVNNHDLDKDTINYLKNNYVTTQTGVFNIFYAFIERSLSILSLKGKLGFIIPNNWMVIESAKPLRQFIKSSKNLYLLIDFGSNLIFNPIKTYNSIIGMNYGNNDFFSYKKIDFVNDIKNELRKEKFSKIYLNDINDKSWHLMSQNERLFINRVQSYDSKIGNYIRTGIATLSDKLYMLNSSEIHDGYYLKSFQSKIYKIEPEITKKIIKVSKHFSEESVKAAKSLIIFPYRSSKEGLILITEEDLKVKFPFTYEYFLDIKIELEKRDKGKAKLELWYQYGRSQGINSFGPKILFPTFSKIPRFFIDEDSSSMFCNGYALYYKDFSNFSNHPVALRRILNSKIMKKYIELTSYSIEGDFKCYQKKYVKDFSIPFLRTIELEFLENEESINKIEDFLLQKYNILKEDWSEIYGN